jgi:hypothetical protein
MCSLRIVAFNRDCFERACIRHHYSLCKSFVLEKAFHILDPVLLISRNDAIDSELFVEQNRVIALCSNETPLHGIHVLGGELDALQVVVAFLRQVPDRGSVLGGNLEVGLLKRPDEP